MMMRMDQTENLKVLLVEDNSETRKLYEAKLASRGFLVEVAVDGLEAYEKIKAGGFAVVLLDVRLPKMSGLDVLEALQKTPPVEKNGPIVMLTNVGDESVVRKAVSLGAASYMDKSHLNPSELVDKVEGLLGVARRG